MFPPGVWFGSEAWPRARAHGLMAQGDDLGSDVPAARSPNSPALGVRTVQRAFVLPKLDARIFSTGTCLCKGTVRYFYIEHVFIVLASHRNIVAS